MPSAHMRSGCRTKHAVRDGHCRRSSRDRTTPASQHPCFRRQMTHQRDSIQRQAHSLEASPSELNGARSNASAGTVEPAALLQTSPDAILTTFTFPQALAGQEILLIGVWILHQRARLRSRRMWAATQQDAART